MSATGATASYEMRLAIADRLNTNEAFLRWATNAVATAVFHLASSKDFHIHGADLTNTNALRIDVKATLSGLRGEASYDPDANSRGPVQFIIEGGTNPIVTMVQDPYGMAGYQLNPKQAGSDTYTRDVARMDWSSATAPLDKAQIEDAARNAYLAMTGSPMPDGVQVNIDVPPVTDGTVRDPSIQISENQGATVATVNNQRYPFADFEFINSESQARVFSGEMIQSAAGTGAFVELFTTQSRSGVQNSVIDLGQEFLSPSGDWQNEVLSKLGSTPQDQVLKKMVQDQYRVETYQLDPELWKRYPRHIGRTDWSHAMQPLDKELVRSLAYRAFNEMTGLELSSFSLEKSEVSAEAIRNPDAAHPEVTITGNINAKLYTPKDNPYPFADFRFDDNGGAHPARVAFSGEMVQTSPGHGEFVNLFAVVRKTEATFELGEKFFGQGTWEQAVLDSVRSLNTEERGQVYRRIFQH